MQPDIIFEDRDLIVLNKPAGIQVERDPFGTPNLQDWVERHCGRGIKIKKGPGVVHRLDKPTTGLVVMAKKVSILKHLNRQFAARSVRKCYFCEVIGHPKPESGRLEHHLVKDDTSNKSLVNTKAVKGSKKAALEYEVLEYREKTTLLDITLLTGRYHQIRAQLAFVGHPVCGDERYGKAAKNHDLHLHASELGFLPPATEEWTVFRSEPRFFKHP